MCRRAAIIPQACYNRVMTEKKYMLLFGEANHIQSILDEVGLERRKEIAAGRPLLEATS